VTRGCFFCAEPVEGLGRFCPHCTSPLWPTGLPKKLALGLSVCLVVFSLYWASRALLSDTLGGSLTRAVVFALGAALAAALVWLMLGLSGRQRRLGLWVWGLASVILSYLVFQLKESKELGAYHAAHSSLASGLQQWAQRAGHPQKLEPELLRVEREWREFSRRYGTKFGHLPSYLGLEGSAKTLGQGHLAFVKGLVARGEELKPDLTLLMKSEAFCPEAQAVYKKEWTKADKLRLAKVLLARRQATAAEAAAERGHQKVAGAQAAVTAAEARVDQAERNSWKEVLGQGNAFSVEFNANKDPGQARQWLYECESRLYALRQEAEQLDEAAQAAREQVAEVDSQYAEAARDQAREARQRVQDSFVQRRWKDRQKQLQAQYLEWFQKLEVARLQQMARAEQLLKGAREAASRESVWPSW